MGDGSRLRLRIPGAREVAVVALSLVLLGCAAPPPGERSSALIGGTADTAHPGVVFLQFVVDPMAGLAARCTASVVSEHVLVTAAHCLTETDLTRYTIFVGQDAMKPMAKIGVAEIHPDPMFVAQTTRDDAVVIADAPLGVAPIPLYQKAIDQTIVGTQLVLLGYGRTVAGDATSDGIRRYVNSPVSGLETEWLDFNDPADAVCRGDSGGPSLMSVNGVEQIVGIHSFGDLNCGGISYDQRIDVAMGFIAPFVAADVNGSSDMAAAPGDGSVSPPRDGASAGGDGGSGGGDAASTTTSVASGCTLAGGAARGGCGPILFAALLLMARRRQWRRAPSSG
jgi:hypothetical protein